MARSSTTATGRDRITTQSRDLISDEGTVLASLVAGEQRHLVFTFDWLTDLNNITVTAKVVEANNDRTKNATIKPTEVHTNPTIATLDIIDANVNDNSLIVVLPHDLSSPFHEQPAPNIPVYGFFGLEIADSGVGSAQQIWKPVRGMIEVLYSPTEQV